MLSELNLSKNQTIINVLKIHEILSYLEKKLIFESGDYGAFHNEPIPRKYLDGTRGRIIISDSM